MPLHDWSRIPAGLFHHFHQDWLIEIARSLNRGRLPDMPLILTDNLHVMVPLESTYQAPGMRAPKRTAELWKPE